MVPNELKIDPSENFAHLRNAPIVEAVIEIRTRAQTPWEEKPISDRLKSRLPDYPRADSQRETQHQFRLGPNITAQSSQTDLGWKGLIFFSADGRYVAQFHRDQFVLSRLQPYESWEQFSREALRLWKIHSEIAAPAEAQRLGLRFVNRIILPAGDPHFEKYLNPHPLPPKGLELPFLSFFHIDTFAVPGYSNYAINVTRAIQNPQETGLGTFALILDIDVFTLQPFEISENLMEMRLGQMRWLKNKAFFGSVTKEALDLFQ